MPAKIRIYQGHPLVVQAEDMVRPGSPVFWLDSALPRLGPESVAYCTRGEPVSMTQSAWLRELVGHDFGPGAVVSNDGLIMARVHDHWFALTFGYGHLEIDTKAVVEEFGAHAALSRIDPDKVHRAVRRSADRGPPARLKDLTRKSPLDAFGVGFGHELPAWLGAYPMHPEEAGRIDGVDCVDVERLLEPWELPALLVLLAETNISEEQQAIVPLLGKALGARRLVAR